MKVKNIKRKNFKIGNRHSIIVAQEQSDSKEIKSTLKSKILKNL